MNDTETQNIPIKIDGKTIFTKPGTTILEVARKAGIYIPHLCYLENIKPYGACRLCIVVIKNARSIFTACTTPVERDMEIKTNSPELQKLRREVFELILSEHPFTCLVCKDKNNCHEFMSTTRKVSVTTGCNFCTNNSMCELQDLVEYLNLEEINFPWKYKEIEPQKNNPFFDIDYNLCVLCGRCVRVCNEIRNSGVLDFSQRGNSMIVGTAFDETQLEAGCEFCGACIDVCPTGSLSEKIGKWRGVPKESVITNCVLCSIACKMNINKKDNRIINVGPKYNERTKPFQLCLRGKFVPGDIVHNPERILNPLIKKGNKWIEVSMQEAIDFTVTNLKKYTGNQFGIIGSAHETLESNYLLQKFSRQVMKSNNIDLQSSLPDKNLIKNIHNYFTYNKAIEIDDLPKADTIFVIGAQTNFSHPIIENRIREAAKNHKTIIVANSHETRTSYFAGHNIIYKQGEENTFLISLLLAFKEMDLGRFRNRFQKGLEDYDINKTLKKCNVSKKDFEKIAELLINSKNLVIVAGDELFSKNDSIFIFNILLNLKKLLKTHISCDIICLLNETNFYGGTLMGIHPDLLPGFKDITVEKNIKKWSENWRTELNKIPGFSFSEMINNIGENGIESLFVVGDIPPFSELNKLKYMIQQNMFLTESSKYANVFFPISSFSETHGHIINIEQKIIELNKVIVPEENVKSSGETISCIARAMQEKGFDFENTENVFDEIKELMDLSFNIKNDPKQDILLDLKRKFPAKKKKFIYNNLRNKYFNYLGNDLTKLIPDLKKILTE